MKTKLTPQDFFLNLLVFATLYASAVSFLVLIFAYLDVLFPDQLEGYNRYAGEVITSSSVLMVVFPVFLFISRLLSKNGGLQPEKHRMGFRKWLIHITLFIAAITMIVDLITLISGFYHGELAARFVYKVLAVLLTAAGVFYYYFLDLKNSARLKPKLSAGLSSAMIVAAILAGFLIVGTPAQQRARRFDERRVNDLQMIQSQLLNYWIQKQELPESLGDLDKDQLSGFVLPTDPETGLDYKYNKLTAFSFELCAEFKTEGKNRIDPIGRSPKEAKPSRGGVFGDPFYQWPHSTGEICFERTIDPEIYQKPK